MHKISVLSYVNLLPETQQLINKFASQTLSFPTDTPSSEEELIARTGNAEAILIGLNVKITASYLDACPSVKYVGLCGTTTASIDLDALAARGVAVANVIDYSDEATAEYIFMRLAMLARGVGEYQWRDLPCELMGKSLTIIGLGALGKAVANLALGYKMRVNYYSKHRKPDLEERGLQFAELHELLPKSDVVVISVPTNTKILGPTEFALMKSGTILVQLSNGQTFEKEAFLEWITKKDRFAIFDYAADEQTFEAYKGLPRVTFSKSVAAYSKEAKERLGQKVLENLKSYFENKSN